MNTTTRCSLALMGMVCLIVTDAMSADTATPSTGSPAYTYPSTPLNYLDAVRAQRQALLDQRRREAKEAVKARRKYLDPWGEAQREARLNEIEQRRRSLDEMAEQHREQIEQMRRDRIRDIYPYTPDYYGWGNPWATPKDSPLIP